MNCRKNGERNFKRSHNIRQIFLFFNGKNKDIKPEGELCGAFNILVKQKEIAFIFECSDALLMRGNEVELKRLFVNLIDNAIKFTPAKGTISIKAQSKDHNIEVIVKDTGIGISKDNLPYLFDRFYRADKSRTRDIGGFGLGLSICQLIVKAHHGTISIKSQLHKGTEVILILPKSLY